MTKATGAAAVLWILGVGTRLAFGLYAEHGGAATMIRFSGWAHLSGFATWTTALLLMSLSEVLGRSTQLVRRMLRAQRAVGQRAGDAEPPDCPIEPRLPGTIRQMERACAKANPEAKTVH